MEKSVWVQTDGAPAILGPKCGF